MQYYNLTSTKINILCVVLVLFICISISQISDKKINKSQNNMRKKSNIIKEYNLMKSQRLNHHFSSAQIPPIDKRKTSQGLFHNLYYHGPRVRP